MKILLPGGAGYIGSHTALALLQSGNQVSIADNCCNSSAEAVARVSALAGKKIPFYPIDLTDRSATAEVFEKEKPDAVIHFAGLKAVGESVKKPLLYYRQNLDITLSVLESMERFHVKNIVFSSSATVYGDGEVPFRETQEHLSCTSPYGWTKLMIEQMLKDFASASNASVVLLRYFNPVGAHPSGKIGEDPQGIPNNLMPYISQVASGLREKLTVFGNDYSTPDGTCIRDYIHICDLAEGHVKAVEYAQSHTGTEIFNLGRGCGVSVLELIHSWDKANHMELPYVIGPRREGDIPVNYADASKAEKLLQWKAERSVEDMCRDAWNWQRNNPHGYKA